MLQEPEAGTAAVCLTRGGLKISMCVGGLWPVCDCAFTILQMYRITSICLGTPPKVFDWEYFDKSKTYCELSGVTPLQFYNEHVKPVYNPQDKVT